jgi:hypothetical protein
VLVIAFITITSIDEHFWTDSIKYSRDVDRTAVDLATSREKAGVADWIVGL